MKVAYIDQHKEEFGVQPICTALAGTDAEIAPSTYYAAHARPESARSLRDRELTEEITVIHARELRRLRRPQDPCRAAAQGQHGGPMHGRAPHACRWPARRDPGQAPAHHLARA